MDVNSDDDEHASLLPPTKSERNSGASQQPQKQEKPCPRLARTSIEASSSSQDGRSRHSRGSHGKITEKRESVDAVAGEREKVTYVFQMSSSSSDNLEECNVEIYQDSTRKKMSHCHTDDMKNMVDKKARRKLIIASVLCTIFMIGEMVGGVLAGSLAIISDAAHLLTDLASFMISLLAIYLASRPATSKLSFGWHRAEILGAFASILLLWVLTGILAFEAVIRVQTLDFEINATVMLITASVGVAFNILLGTTLHQHSHSHGGGGHSHGGDSKAPPTPPRAVTGDAEASRTVTDNAGASTAVTNPAQGIKSYGTLDENNRATADHENHTAIEVSSEVDPHGSESQNGHGHGHSHAHKENNINVRAAFIHVIGDLLQSIGVLIAALLIYFKPEWKLADPICTFLFSFLVIVTTFTVMKDIVMVLMEAAPKGLSFKHVRKTLMAVDSVVDVHNLRLWSLTMDKVAVSAHLAIDKDANPHEVLKAAYAKVRQTYSMAEMTFQIEEYITEMENCDNCQELKN